MTATVANKIISVEDLVAESQRQDTGKDKFDTNRKNLEFGFCPDQDTGKSAFYVKALDLPDRPEFEGQPLYFTTYSWRQFWQRFVDYPLSGVTTKRIPEHLIRKIAESIMQKKHNVGVTLKIRKNSDWQQSGGKKGKLFLRGYVTNKRVDYATTALLQAMKIAPSANGLNLRKLPNFPDHMFNGRFRFPGQVQGDPEVGCMLQTSEVGACKTSFNVIAALPEHGVHFIAKKFGKPVLTIDKQHSDPAKLIEDLNLAVKESSKHQDELKEHIERSKDAVLTKPETKIRGLGGRWGLPQDTVNAVLNEFKAGVSSKRHKATKLGMAIALAKVGRRRKDPEFRCNLEAIAGSIIQSKT